VEFSKWFECEIFDAVINLLQWCDDKVHWTIKVVSLWDKISWWAKFLKFFLKKKTRLAPWMEEGVQNLLAQIGSCVLWIPSITNVLPLLGGDKNEFFQQRCNKCVVN
jgi:hypothetical protein